MDSIEFYEYLVYLKKCSMTFPGKIKPKKKKMVIFEEKKKKEKNYKMEIVRSSFSPLNSNQ